MGFLDLLLIALVLHMGWVFWERARPKRIFVVEDSETDRMLFKINFHIENCVVDYFPSTESIIKEFWKRKPDAVIIDYFLAGKTKGDQLLKFCDNNKIPALLVTGNEGNILGVDPSRIVRKTANESYYKTLENWAKEVTA